MIWHLPHLAALARHAERGRISLIAKPSALAGDLLAGEPAVDRHIPLDRGGRRPGRHDGPLGLVRFIASLRAQRIDSVVVLHHSRTLAFAMQAAGIAQRFGYGYPGQHAFLNRPPFLAPAYLALHPYQQASAYLAAAGWDQGLGEPVVAIKPGYRLWAEQRFATPVIAVGVGSSEPYKQWGGARFAELAVALQGAGWPCIALIGGAAEAAMISAIAARCTGAVPVVGEPLGAVAAVLARAAFYVGNDTGIMNLAAAVGCRSYGLFGGTDPLTHSTHIVPVLPPGGVDRTSGMQAISVATVKLAIDADGRWNPSGALANTGWGLAGTGR